MKILSIGVEADNGGGMVVKQQINNKLVERGHSVDDLHLPNQIPVLPKVNSISQIRQRIDRYDLVHCHSIVGSHALSSALAVGASTTPLVYHTHTAFFSDISWKERYLLRYLLRFQTSQSDAVIYVSELERELLSSYISPSPSSAVIENRVVIEEGSSNGDLENFPEVQEPYMISVGTISQRKGQHRIVEAMQYFDELDLVLVGNIETNIYKQIADQGLSESVHVLGRVEPDSSVHALISNAEGLIHMSSYESYGLVIPEALAHGVPVVCSDRCGAKELITSENGRVVPVNSNTKNLINAIHDVVYLSPDPNNSVRDWSRAISKIEQIYEVVLRCTT